MVRYFFKKQTPSNIARIFRTLMRLQIFLYVVHLWTIFRAAPSKSFWSFHGELKYQFKDPNNLWNNRLQFGKDVIGDYTKLELTFPFATFQEFLSIYTISYFIVDFLKWGIVVFAFWQLSKAFSDKEGFIGFSDEGVKRFRLAAIPIVLIPLLDYLSNRIFVSFVCTQSAFEGF